MTKSKKERLAEMAAKSVNDGQAIIDGVSPVSLGERLSWMGAQPIQPAPKSLIVDFFYDYPQ